MCGIFGFAKTSGRQNDNQLDILRRITTELTDESSIRGTDSTGFSIIDEDNRYTYKTLTDSSTLVDTPDWSNILSRINRDTTIFMGHVRLATTGSVKVENAHPFNIGNVTGVHNGIIHNYNQVSRTLGKEIPDVDSQVLFQALNRRQMDRAFEDIDGDFAITWVKDSNSTVHLARESGRPMVVAYWKKARVLLWASTKQIMQDAMTRAGLRLPIKEVAEDFIFTYRGLEPREMIHYLIEIGVPIAIPNKEKSKFKFKYPTNDVKNQREFLSFSKGEMKSLTKIKAMFKGMHPQYQLKTIEQLEAADSGSYDIKWLVDKGVVVSGVKNIDDFQKISKVSTIQMKNYIREIVNNNRDLEKKRVFLENIHTIKGKEFDNVVFDFKLTRQENLFSKKRMKFVACSRARKTLWLLKSTTNLTFAGKEDLQ